MIATRGLLFVDVAHLAPVDLSQPAPLGEDVILCCAQTDPAANGVYRISAARAYDPDVPEPMYERVQWAGAPLVMAGDPRNRSLTGSAGDGLYRLPAAAGLTDPITVERL